jgi:UDP-N-acetyl-D-galactosamine dehydrogenase
VIENTQRDLNIALINELALIFNRMGISTEDVLLAAGSKWNFLPFRPGLVGGHCLGVDPYYLAHKATLLGHSPQVILSGRKVNDAMSTFIAEKLIRLINPTSKPIQGARVLILGVTFKENCPDIRNSKVFEIVHYLKEKGMEVSVFDPFANAEEVAEKHSIHLITQLETYDAIVITVAHTFFASLDFSKLKNSESTIIFDTKCLLDKKIVTARL